MFPPPAALPAHSGEVPSLDGARAASIILVLASHYIDYQHIPGGLGVLTFFVISGFLITRLMIAERRERGHFDVSAFFFRRAFRLLPALFVFCAVASVAFLWFDRSKFDEHELMATLFYVENYFTVWQQQHHVQSPLLYRPFWSLSVEEQFYLGFAATAYFWATTPKRLLYAAAFATIVPLLLRFAYALAWPQFVDPESLFIYARTETRINSIAAGMLIASMCEFELGRRVIGRLTQPVPVMAAFLAVPISYVLIRDEFFRDTLRYTILNGSVAILLCAVVFTARYWPLNWLLNLPIARWIGDRSYSLYIWHLGVLMAVSSVAGSMPFAARSMLEFALVFALAAASYSWLEEPAKGFREPAKQAFDKFRRRWVRSATPRSRSAT